MPLIIDTANIYRCVRKKFGKGARLMYEEFVPQVEKIFGKQEHKIAYVMCPTNTAKSFITFIEHLDFDVQTKEPREVELEPGVSANIDDFNVDLSIDALDLAHKDEPMIICSSDFRLLPLIETLEDRCALVLVWAVGIPHSFKCGVREIQPEFIRNVDNAAT